jgi:hypothetical protein
MGACAEQMKTHGGGDFLAAQGDARVAARKRDSIAPSASQEIHGVRSLSTVLFERKG